MRFLANRHSWMALGLACAMLGVGSTQAQTNDEPKKAPTGEALMDNYIKATGGKEAYAKIKTAVMKGTFKFAGVAGDMTIHIKSPNLMHFVMNLQNIGNVEAGYDGKIFWENNPITGAKITDSNQQKDLMPGLDFGADGDWRKQFKKVTNEGEEKVNDKPAYKVKLEDNKGGAETRYFDKSSGLLVRMKKAVKSELGSFTMDADIGDYKKVGGLLIPHSTVATLLNQKIEMTLSSVKLNVDVPDNKFELPPAIRELLKKKQK